MSGSKKVQQAIKGNLHPRNKHRGRYDFELLIEHCPALKDLIKINPYGNESIDFFNPTAVKMLNKAILMKDYGIENWDIPAENLCPPIPGRADYIHYIADLIAYDKNSKTPKQINCLDIGVGANCIYPIIGISEYDWTFVGSDINPKSLESADNILKSNRILNGKLTLRLQTNPTAIFSNVIQTGEYFDVSICNPPFHRSAEEANSGTQRKLKNLKGQKQVKVELNFGGNHQELWCTGGEESFVHRMIIESKNFASSCGWFTTLISKESNLKKAYATLQKVNAQTVKTIPMSQGNKTSRILAWKFEK